MALRIILNCNSSTSRHMDMVNVLLADGKLSAQSSVGRSIKIEEFLVVKNFIDDLA